MIFIRAFSKSFFLITKFNEFKTKAANWYPLSNLEIESYLGILVRRVEFR